MYRNSSVNTSVNHESDPVPARDVRHGPVTPLRQGLLELLMRPCLYVNADTAPD